MRFSKRYFLSFLTSVPWWLGLAISLTLSLLTARIMEEKAAAKFTHLAENAGVNIQARVESYIDVLRGVCALFYTTDHISRAQFHSYVGQLNLAQRFPGIRSLNFAPLVSAKDKQSFENWVRNDKSLDPNGYPDFSITPPGNRPDYHVLTYQEPSATGLGNFGLDIASNDVARQSLEASRDSGLLTASGRLIRIVGPYRHTGLAMRMPLYRAGMPLKTVEQRRAAYYGSVGAGFDIDRLMLGAVDQRMLHYMRVKLYDATGHAPGVQPSANPDPERMLYDSAADDNGEQPLRASKRSEAFFIKMPLQIGSRLWEMEFSAPKSSMLDTMDAVMPWMVLAFCLTALMLLHSVYFSLASARERAVEIANDMTKDLRTSETNLAEAQHMARLGSWLLDPVSHSMVWSNETYRILGLQHAAETSFEDFLRRIYVDDRDAFNAAFSKALRGHEECTLEHRITRVDGKLCWVQSIIRSDKPDAERRLLRGTIMDITDRKEALEALERSQELLRELTAHQDRVKEEERKRIAREIHDELGQTLLALRIDIAMLEARTGQSHPRLNQKVRTVLSHIDGTVKTIRTIINNLRPAVLDLGLTAAIEWQIGEFERRSGIQCELIIGTRELTVDDTRATALFRVLQESLTNVLRHAEATRVVIRLYQENGQLVMRITDNGVGIYPSSRRKANSFGLVGVEERINALNGRCVISSVPGEGTTVSITIPLEPAQRARTA
jgi:PAS domain S-box-containing protein